MKTLNLILVAPLTAGACDFGSILGSESETELFVAVDEFYGPGSKLDSPTGLAGLRVEISGIAQSAVTLTASDFVGLDWREGYRIPGGVPDHGTATIAVTLSQGDTIVASGEVSLRFRPRTDSWHISLTRTDHAWGSDLIGNGHGCVDHLMFCVQVVRFLISEDAANEPDEAIWLMVQRVHPDGPCPGAGPNAICGD